MRSTRERLVSTSSRLYPIELLLPHQHPMILLDEVIAYDAQSIRARVKITPSSVFFGPDGVPAYVGIEYMAQTCGAYAGAHAQDKGQPVRVGFLLGTRRYDCRLPYFCLGDELVVSATAIYKDDEMGSFDCKIEVNGLVAATAQLTVYQPPDKELTGEEQTRDA